MNRRNIFLIIACVYQLSNLNGQGCTSLDLRRLTPLHLRIPVERHATAKVPQQSALVVLPGWSVCDLPIFCKVEYQMAKHLPIPIQFRLGSVDYVNRLECKPGYDLLPVW